MNPNPPTIGPDTCLNVHHSRNHYGYISDTLIIVYGVTMELSPRALLTLTCAECPILRCTAVASRVERNGIQNE
jgi:hypothetical protein